MTLAPFVRGNEDLNLLKTVCIHRYANGDALTLDQKERVDSSSRIIYYELFYGEIISGVWLDRYDLLNPEFFLDEATAITAYEKRLAASDQGKEASGLTDHATLNSLLRTVL